MRVEPLNKSFGAKVYDLRIPELGTEQLDAIYSLWLKYALLIFPEQDLNNYQQIKFAKNFGALEFDLSPISNVRGDGSIRDANDDDIVKSLRGNMEWHHDSTYMPIQAKGAVFTAHTVPSKGGETGWADMRAAYDNLSENMKKYDVLNDCLQKARHFSIMAKDSLGTFPDNEEKQKLINLVNFLTHRKN